MWCWRPGFSSFPSLATLLARVDADAASFSQLDRAGHDWDDGIGW
jgi:hypothetical protein